MMSRIIVLPLIMCLTMKNRMTKNFLMELFTSCIRARRREWLIRPFYKVFTVKIMSIDASFSSCKNPVFNNYYKITKITSGSKTATLVLQTGKEEKQFLRRYCPG